MDKKEIERLLKEFQMINKKKERLLWEVEELILTKRSAAAPDKINSLARQLGELAGEYKRQLKVVEEMGEIEKQKKEIKLGICTCGDKFLINNPLQLTMFESHLRECSLEDRRKSTSIN